MNYKFEKIEIDNAIKYRVYQRKNFLHEWELNTFIDKDTNISYTELTTLQLSLVLRSNTKLYSYLPDNISKDIIKAQNEQDIKDHCENRYSIIRWEHARQIETLFGAKEIGDLSDGYHTFNELYDFRREYNAALVNTGVWPAHKSHKHHDGELCFGGGWFIVMIETPFGQISNHYEDKYWDEFHCEEKEIADEWDGHTEKDVIERLMKCNNENL